ncbi:EAL domain-containing protein [Butyrivibrio sp. MB2005]|uniref:EAL domain-containing protein n=1 Tax=Butyrivibrio sp. MB2005 TaxID=1280678 RepID=UPI0003F77F7F|nr:bifunctional diguanylate cyclase/phosphodiesterase [Butyrivibrio sp. MB2005]
MRVDEYTYKDLGQMMDTMKRMYDTVRLVDPIECREITVDASGGVHYGKECHSVWNATSRCSNCSSYRACLSSNRQSKEEIYENRRHLIQSIPIKLLLPDDNSFSCVLELISVDTQNLPQPGEAIVPILNSEGIQLSQGMTDTDYVVTHDPLTRLFNLDGICRAIRKLLVDDPDVDRLLITGDIRHFRVLNKRYGRQRGNEVLIAIADMLRKRCGSDTVYGRIQADHFVLCMPENRFDEGTFIDAVEEIGKLVDSENYHLYFHLGVYRIDDPEIPVTTMIERADLALQSLHDQRENILTFYTNKLLKQSEDEEEFLSTFENNLSDGQFTIYVQPLFNSDKAVTGVEALTRWIKPNGTVVPSEKYIGILEKTEHIAQLDYKNWELVMRQLSAWQNTSKYNIIMGVNVTPKVFFYMDALKALKELVNNYRIDPNRLVLEFSEVDLMNDTEKQFELIDAFRAEGFRVAIDNFGIGNVSLNMLKDVHAEYVKFDRTFIAGSESDPRSKMILESSLKLCKSLGMNVVAEGIETEQQFEYLKSLGCDRFQGYYLARPMPISEFESNF